MKKNFCRLKTFLIKNKIELLYSFIITVVFFGLFVKENYTTDTYADIMMSYRDISGNFLRSGRFVTWIFYSIYKLVDNFSLFYSISFLTAIISIASSIFLLGQILYSLRPKNGNKIPYLLSAVIVINPFSIELMFYFEKGIMALAILFAILAADYFRKYIHNHNKTSLAKSFLFAIGCCFSYQGILGLYVILCAMFALLKEKKIIEACKNIIVAVIIYAITVILNLGLSKIIVGSVKGGEFSIRGVVSALFVILEKSQNVFSLFGVLPSTIIWVGFIITLVLILKKCIKSNKHWRTVLINCLILMTVIVVFVLLPHMAQSSTSVWLTPRSCYPFGAGIFIIIAYVACEKRAICSNNKNLRPIYVSCIIVLFLEFFNFNQIIVNHYETNVSDRLLAYMIEERISEYEGSNDSKIESIAVVRSEGASYIYPGIKAVGDAQVMALATDWSDVNMINYYTGRELTKLGVDENMQKLCQENSAVSDIVFDNDSVYICKNQ